MPIEQMEKSIPEAWNLSKETDSKFKATDAEFKETDKVFTETDKKIKRLAALFSSRWSNVVESLVKRGIMEQFQSRGINITNLARRLVSDKHGHHLELDFLLTSENEVVIGEVRTMLQKIHVQDFIQKIKAFHNFFYNYRRFKLYGAMIGIRMEQEVDKYAYRKGLFVLQVGDKGRLIMLNDADFKPKDFSIEAKQIL